MLLTFCFGFALGSYYQRRRGTKLRPDESPYVPEPDLVPLITKPDRWTESEWQEFKNRNPEKSQ